MSMLDHIRKLCETLDAIGPVTELMIVHNDVANQIPTVNGCVDTREPWKREIHGGSAFFGIPIATYHDNDSMQTEIAIARAAGLKHVKIYDEQGRDITNPFWQMKIRHRPEFKTSEVQP